VLFSAYGIPDDRITVVVNRHSKRATVSLEDIQRTLARDSLAVVPNQFKSVLSCIDGGVPILEFEPSSPVARAIVDLQRTICGAPPVERTGLLRRALPIFSGNE
jgi:pilus assembly protein CpaE